MPPLVEVEGLRVSARDDAGEDVPIVADVSFALNKGEVLAPVAKVDDVATDRSPDDPVGQPDPGHRRRDQGRQPRLGRGRYSRRRRASGVGAAAEGPGRFGSLAGRTGEMISFPEHVKHRPARLSS